MFDLLMFEYQYLVGGALLMALFSFPIFAYWHHRQIVNLRVDLMQRLPMTLEQIDANLELQKAHHMVDVCKYELELAKLREAEAESNAKFEEARSRIDDLNRKLEMFQIKQAASRRVKAVRKVEEKLMDLDNARNVLDKKADKVS